MVPWHHYVLDNVKYTLGNFGPTVLRNDKYGILSVNELPIAEAKSHTKHAY